MAISIASLLQEFCFKVATGEEIPPALDLFRAVYQADIGFVPMDGIEQSATHLIAKTTDGRIASSLRYAGSEHRPFLFENACDTSTLLPKSARPALLSRFCVAPPYRAAPRSIALHFGMLKLAIEHARSRKATDLLQYTQPHLVNFYRAAFFVPTGITFDFAPLDEKMHVLRLDLETLDERCRASRSRGAMFILSQDLVR